MDNASAKNVPAANAKKELRALKWRQYKKNIRKTWVLYLFVLPALIYMLLFNYLPMYGVQIAFRDYKATQGIIGSKWVGFKHFKTFFESYQFGQLIKNTLALSFYSLIAGFPFPVIYALFLTYLDSNRLRRSSQMITYAPHFISTVVYVGMITLFLGREGVVNNLIAKLGASPVPFMGKGEWFRHIYVWSGILKSTGWNSIMYISVLATVPPELHEAAIVDGANKRQRMLYIDLPTLLPTMIILLILNTGQLLNVGFEKAFLLQNSVNLDYSEIISTYVYKIGILSSQFSYSAAIGLFNNVINFAVILFVNKMAAKYSEISLW